MAVSLGKEKVDEKKFFIQNYLVMATLLEAFNHYNWRVYLIFLLFMLVYSIQFIDLSYNRNDLCNGYYGKIASKVYNYRVKHDGLGNANVFAFWASVSFGLLIASFIYEQFPLIDFFDYSLVFIICLLIAYLTYSSLFI